MKGDWERSEGRGGMYVRELYVQRSTRNVLYLHLCTYTYIHMKMRKKRQLVKRKRLNRGRAAQAQAAKSRAAKSRTVGRLRAAADEGELTDMVSDWSGYYRPIKKPVTLRPDADILAWFKKQGRGYQTRINRALRKVMVEGRKS